MIPVKCKEEDDFREIVKENLNSYILSVKNLDVNERPESWDYIKSRIKQLCDGINRAIEYEYRGTRHSAYTTIKNQLDGYATSKRTIEGLGLNRSIFTIRSGEVAYRMRSVDLADQHKLETKDMFHIPLDKRGLVETQRYSVPGYPCLYLAHRVYGCWEEMGRPNFGTVMVSRFEVQKEMKMLDLRVPTKEAWNNDMIKCLLIYPLVIASMVQVKNRKDTYKPEYLIPQLLTEWVISSNRNKQDNKEEILGIAYTSVHKNDDFSFPEDSFVNYSIPVLKPIGSKKYCKRLKDYFKLTAPTYYDLEVLKHGQSFDAGMYDLEEEDAKEHNLKLSHFGMMESYMREIPLATIIDEP